MFHTSMQKVHRRGTFALTAAGAAMALAITAAVPLHAGAGAQKPAASQKPTVNITLTSKPSPPKTGDNTFEVIVKDSAGRPITDAEVTAMFHMGAMGAMPAMKNNVVLKHQKEGRYAGTGQVMMAGKWEVTVMVTRAGKEIGSKKFPVTAQ